MTFSFTEGSAQAICRVHGLLNEFYILSGLKCNPSKCEVYFGGQYVLFKSNALQMSGFQEGKLPVRYLGLPLFYRKLSSTDCDKLVAKITTKIGTWRAKQLSCR
ncbi:unnamed protein product [Linum trigynum]|uniref:Reverse transcriptase n=1 Tax=Linum trigynum TaxID=586398 RepID=A0AAV2CFP4_9ROSI